MHDVEVFCNKVEQARTKTRQIAQDFKAALRKRQSIVLELHDKLESSKHERRRYTKAIEDGFEDVADLMRRYQLMMERKQQDMKRVVALADICDEKQKHLELHTLELHLHDLLKARIEGEGCLADLAVKWAGLQVVLIPVACEDNVVAQLQEEFAARNSCLFKLINRAVDCIEDQLSFIRRAWLPHMPDTAGPTPASALLQPSAGA